MAVLLRRPRGGAVTAADSGWTRLMGDARAPGGGLVCVMAYHGAGHRARAETPGTNLTVLVMY